MNKKRPTARSWMADASRDELLAGAVLLQIDSRRQSARARAYREEPDTPALAIQAQQAAARSSAQARMAYRLATGEFA